jgi:hypothetical protein
MDERLKAFLRETRARIAPQAPPEYLPTFSVATPPMRGTIHTPIADASRDALSVSLLHTLLLYIHTPLLLHLAMHFQYDHANGTAF